VNGFPLFGTMTMFCVTLFIPFLALLTLFPAIVNAAALAARASSTPSCYVCPSKDKNGRVLFATNSNNNVLSCSYTNAERYCDYNLTTGVLTTDNDSGHCPSTATSTCNPSKRENIVQVVKRRAAARAAQPKPASPGFMNAGSALRKKKKSLQNGKRSQ